MGKRIKPIQIGHEPGEEASRFSMEALVYNLNTSLTMMDAPSALHSLRRSTSPIIVDFAEMKAELRRLVKAWNESGPNLIRMFEQDRELERRTMHGRTMFMATGSGRGHLSWLPAPTGLDPLSQKDHALMHFMGLISNPEWELLGGPCARCGNYYLKKTKKQKVYCSRTCGSAGTAIPATKRKREEVHAQKIKRAQKIIDQWPGHKTKKEWKPWILAKLDPRKYTLQWLTRAVNNKELRPPRSARIRKELNGT